MASDSEDEFSIIMESEVTQDRNVAKGNDSHCLHAANDGDDAQYLENTSDKSFYLKSEVHEDMLTSQDHCQNPIPYQEIFVNTVAYDINAVGVTSDGETVLTFKQDDHQDVLKNIKEEEKEDQELPQHGRVQSMRVKFEEMAELSVGKNKHIQAENVYYENPAQENTEVAEGELVEDREKVRGNFVKKAEETVGNFEEDIAETERPLERSTEDIAETERSLERSTEDIAETERSLKRSKEDIVEAERGLERSTEDITETEKSLERPAEETNTYLKDYNTDKDKQQMHLLEEQQEEEEFSEALDYLPDDTDPSKQTLFHPAKYSRETKEDLRSLEDTSATMNEDVSGEQLTIDTQSIVATKAANDYYSKLNSERNISSQCPARCPESLLNFPEQADRDSGQQQQLKHMGSEDQHVGWSNQFPEAKEHTTLKSDVEDSRSNQKRDESSDQFHQVPQGPKAYSTNQNFSPQAPYIYQASPKPGTDLPPYEYYTPEFLPYPYQDTPLMQYPPTNYMMEQAKPYPDNRYPYKPEFSAQGGWSPRKPPHQDLDRKKTLVQTKVYPKQSPLQHQDTDSKKTPVPTKVSPKQPSFQHQDIDSKKTPLHTKVNPTQQPHQPVSLTPSQARTADHLPVQSPFPTSKESSNNLVVPATVRVDGLDSTIEEELLELYFENPKRSGGDTIIELVDHRSKGFVLITFESQEVAKRVLKQNHKIGHKVLQVSLHQENDQKSEDISANRTVEVHGGSPALKEMMTFYFENPKKSGGGDIESLKMEEKSGITLITFVQAAAAEGVLQRKHEISGTKLTVSLPRPSEPSRTIRVSGLKPSISKDLLEIYFENPKSGGGDVQDMQLDSKKGEALITFVNAAVVQNVLKRTHRLSDCNIIVTLADESLRGLREQTATSQAEESLVIEVNGLNPDTSKDTLTLYFENKQTGAGYPVHDVQLDSQNRRALVTFEDAEAVKRVLEKKHTIDGHTLKVSVHAVSQVYKTHADDSQAESLDTIVVSGFDPSVTSDDSLTNYFENTRRSGGGDVKAVKIDNAKGLAYVTFEDAEVAANVITRVHKINNRMLDVHLYTPPPLMMDHILISGLPDLQSSDPLKYFVESKTDYEVKTVLFSDVEGIAVVIFDQNIDLKQIQSKLAKPFLNCKLSVEPIPVSSTILVQDLPSTASEDKLINYFENTRRSGGEEVREVKIVNGQHALVTFADFKVTEVVAGRKHTLDGSPVKVSLYFECLGTSGGSLEPCLNLPDPFVLSESDSHKLLIIRNIPVLNAKLNSSLENCYASMDWDTVSPQTGVVCMLTKEIPNAHQLARTWKCSVENLVQEYLKNICIEEAKISIEEFQQAENTLRQIAHEAEIDIFMDDNNENLYMVSENKEIKNVTDSMKKVIKEIGEKISRQKNEKVEKRKYSRAQMELIQSLINESNFQVKYPQLEMNYLFEEGVLEIRGLPEEIQEVNLAIGRILSQISSSTHQWDSNLVCQLLQGPAKEVFRTACLELDPKGKVEFSPDGFGVHSFDETLAEAMCMIGRRIVNKRVFKLPQGCEEIQELPEWKRLLSELQERNKDLLLIQETRELVTLVGIQQTFAHDVQQVADFILKYCIHEEVYPVSQADCFRFLEPFFQDDLAQQKALRDNIQIDVRFVEQNSNVVMRGNFAGIKMAKEMLNQFTKNMVYKKRAYNLPGMSRFLKFSDWLRKKTSIEDRLHCRITELSQSHLYSTVDEDVGISQRNLFDRAFSRTPTRNLPLRKSKGPATSQTASQSKSKVQPKVSLPTKPRIFVNAMSDITKEEHHVLVNSTNPGLKLDNGQVSTALLEVGGPTIQEECKEKYPSGIQVGEIAVTGAGKLLCKNLFHCTLPDEQIKEKIHTDVQNAVTKCLEEAERMGHRSIGFPAIGTGNLNYPSDVVAQAMFKAVLEYGINHPNCNISDVVFILHKKDTNNKEAFNALRDEYVRLLKESSEVEEESESESEDITSIPNQSYLFFQDTKSNVLVEFIAMKSSDVDEAEEEILNLYKSYIEKKTMDSTQIAKWADEYVERILNAGNAAHVDVILNNALDRIEFQGFRDKVGEVYICAEKARQEAEKRIQDEQQAERMAKLVQWSFIEWENYEEKLKPYGTYVSYQLENAYKEGKLTHILLDENRTPCKFDFTKMTEEPEILPGQDEDIVPVIIVRRDLIQESAVDVPPPQNWRPMGTNLLDVVTLQETDNDYKQVETAFMNTCELPNVQITKISRVQNLSLYKLYMAAKQNMEKNSPNKVIEKHLWHGTKEGAVDSIINMGFNRGYCDMDEKRSAYGHGVYFATKAGYSSREQYAAESATGERRIFYSKVLTGSYTNGIQGMRFPPQMPSGSKKYDSVVDDINDPGIYVIFSDVQAYPEYLIVFKG